MRRVQPRLPSEVRSRRSIESIMPGTMGGRIASASPVRRRFPRRQRRIGPPLGSGFFAHYRADLITGLTDTDPVLQWDDQSGNDRHLVPGTAGREPTYVEVALNGLPGVSFELVDGFTPMVEALFTAVAVERMAFVIAIAQVQQTGGEGNLCIVHREGQSDTALYVYRVGSDEIAGIVEGPSATHFAESASAPLNVTEALVEAAGEPTGVEVWVDGVSVAADTGADAEVGQVDRLSVAEIGIYTTMCELVVLADGDVDSRGTVAAEVADRWGL